MGYGKRVRLELGYFPRFINKLQTGSAIERLSSMLLLMKLSINFIFIDLLVALIILSDLGINLEKEL